MKSLVLVSSKTGNTYKIARYVQKGFGCGCDLKRTTEKYDLSAYDTVLVGFGLIRGMSIMTHCPYLKVFITKRSEYSAHWAEIRKVRRQQR